jgi:hypothetical protein
MSDAFDQAATGRLSRALGPLDTPQVAGLLVVGSLLLLGSLRKGFGGIRVALGD